MKCWAGKINLILAVIGTVMVVNIHTSQAQKETTKPTAYQVKATFIYNFTQFVEWPAPAFAHATAPIEIGIFGKDPFGSVIDRILRDVHVQGRPIVVRRATQLTDLQSCQVIFISRSESKFLPHVLREFENRPVLTISDIDQFARIGGMIGFITKENKIRFQINLKATRKAELKISSRVLRLAEIIEGAAGDEH